MSVSDAIQNVVRAAGNGYDLAGSVAERIGTMTTRTDDTPADIMRFFTTGTEQLDAVRSDALASYLVLKHDAVDFMGGNPWSMRNATSAAESVHQGIAALDSGSQRMMNMYGLDENSPKAALEFDGVLHDFNTAKAHFASAESSRYLEST